MTRDDILRMAREAGLPLAWISDNGVLRWSELERFAALVAAAKDAEHQKALAWQQRSYEREIQLEVEEEREECAQVCEGRYMGDNSREDMEARRCADAIRARSKT